MKVDASVLLQVPSLSEGLSGAQGMVLTHPFPGADGEEAPCPLLWCQAAQRHLVSLISHLEVPWPGASPDTSEEDQFSPCPQGLSSHSSRGKVTSFPLPAHAEDF